MRNGTANDRRIQIKTTYLQFLRTPAVQFLQSHLQVSFDRRRLAPAKPTKATAPETAAEQVLEDVELRTALALEAAEVHAARPESALRHPASTALQTLSAVAIVDAALLHVAQHFIGFANLHVRRP